jgi:MFS family permease
MILAGAFLVLAAESHVLWLSVLALFLPMAFDFPAVSGISYSTVPSLFPATAVAKATGAFMVLGSLSGLGGPYVTGFLVGQQGGFSLALLTAASVVAVGGVVALVGIRPRDLEVKRSGIGASASARSLFRESSHPARGRPTRRKCGLFLD